MSGPRPKRRPTLSREAMYQIIRAPLITEKATMLSEDGQFVFRVATGCEQARDQGGGRGPVRRHGAGGQHAGAEGQDQALQGAARPALGREEGVRQAGRRPVDRFHHRPRIGRARDGTQAIQSGHGEPARHGADQPFRAVEGQAGQDADRGQERHRRAQQPRPHHQPLHRRRAQAGVSLRRFQAAQVRRAGDGGAAGIRSEPQRVHRAGEVPGRRAVLHPGAAAAARGRQRGVRPARATSSRATRCRWRRSRSAPSSTTSR